MRLSVLLLFSTITLFSAVESNADEAEYLLTFEGLWTSTLPGGAHFSPLVGATHANDGAILTVGTLASQGVENVAEVGSPGVLVSEINAGIAAGTIADLVARAGNVGPTQTVTIEFSANASHSLLTLITMIAPSPDWFVGVHNLDLLDADGQWIQEIVIDLNSYDAGTENGSTYSTSNAATVPQDVIRGLDIAVPDGPLVGFGSIARITLTRTDVDEFRAGDVNQDGDIDLLDVQLFVELISTGNYQIEADVNCDNVVNMLDVAPFVDLIIGS